MEIKQLTFTRFVAAFIIILFHYGHSAIPFDSGLFGHFAKEGAFSVSYFFCLSGYILAHVYYKDDNTLINKKVFFIKRFARIYPIYLIGFLAALISGIVLLNVLPKGYSIILQLLGFHVWVPGICLEINYPGWSLSAELFFYLSFPFLMNIFKKLSNRKLVIVTLVIWALSTISHILLVKMSDNSMKWGEFILFNPLFNINAFVFGMASSIVLKRRIHKLEINNFLSSSIFLVFCLILFLIIATDNFILPWGHNGLFAPLFVLIIISLQLNSGIISKLFSLRPLVFLGEISYGIYILQHPVRLWFEEMTKNYHIGKSSIFYLYLLILILVSAIIYICVERPVRKWLVKKYA